MKRITIEQAQKYIPLDDDEVNKNLHKASYYTLSPYPDPEMASKGWEKVTYYFPKRNDVYFNRGEGNQWIYILSNPSIPDVLKIGYTTLTPELRAKQISASTGVVVPFKVEWTFQCFDGSFMETEVHDALKEYRISNQREFFQIDLEEAKNIITLIGKKYTSN
jgi:hypothetical protein